MLIQYQASSGSSIEIKVYDRQGQEVRVLNAGTNSASWDGRNESGSVVASGVYILVLKQGDKIVKKKVVVVK